MYTVRKPINLKGKRRVIGAVVSCEDVDPERASFFIRNGYLSRIDSGLPESAGESLALVQDDGRYKAREGEIEINVPIIKKDGNMVISVSQEGIIEAIRLIQTALGEAVPEIEQIQDENILILLDACDSRKAIKEAAKERAAVLRKDQEGTTEKG